MRKRTPLLSSNITNNELSSVMEEWNGKMRNMGRSTPQNNCFKYGRQKLKIQFATLELYQTMTVIVNYYDHSYMLDFPTRQHRQL